MSVHRISASCVALTAAVLLCQSGHAQVQAPPAAPPAAQPAPPAAAQPVMAQPAPAPRPRRMRQRRFRTNRFGEISLSSFTPVGDRNFGLLNADEFTGAAGLSLIGGRRVGPVDIGLRFDIGVGPLNTNNWEQALGQELDPSILFNVAVLGRYNLIRTRRLAVYVGAEVGVIVLNANLTNSGFCVLNDDGSESCTQDSGVSYAGFSVAGTVGARFRLTRRLAVGVESRYITGAWFSRSFDDGFGSVQSTDVSDMNLDYVTGSLTLRLGF